MAWMSSCRAESWSRIWSIAASRPPSRDPIWANSAASPPICAGEFGDSRFETAGHLVRSSPSRRLSLAIASRRPGARRSRPDELPAPLPADRPGPRARSAWRPPRRADDHPRLLLARGLALCQRGAELARQGLGAVPLLAQPSIVRFQFAQSGLDRLHFGLASFAIHLQPLDQAAHARSRRRARRSPSPAPGTRPRAPPARRGARSPGSRPGPAPRPAVGCPPPALSTGPGSPSAPLRGRPPCISRSESRTRSSCASAEISPSRDSRPARLRVISSRSSWARREERLKIGQTCSPTGSRPGISDSPWQDPPLLAAMRTAK